VRLNLAIIFEVVILLTLIMFGCKFVWIQMIRGVRIIIAELLHNFNDAVLANLKVKSWYLWAKRTVSNDSLWPCEIRTDCFLSASDSIAATAQCAEVFQLRKHKPN